jgi:hypothetical protein
LVGISLPRGRAIEQLLFEQPAVKLGLANDGRECADPEFAVIRHRNGYCRRPKPPLHHDVSATRTHLLKAMLGQY